MFTKAAARYWAFWSAADDIRGASERQFASREECQRFAEDRLNRGIEYVWLAEWGRYRAKGEWRKDLMYFWWSTAAAAGDVGREPKSGWGVPEDKSWRYHVEYEPASPSN